MTSTDVISNLKKQREFHLNEYKKIDRAIAALVPTPTQYMNWKEKALDCIRSNECYSQTADILLCVVGKEVLKDEVLRRRYITALSVTLNELNKIGVLKKFRLKSVKGDFYGLAEWFTKNGSLKKEYYSTTIMNFEHRINELIQFY